MRHVFVKNYCVGTHSMLFFFNFSDFVCFKNLWFIVKKNCSPNFSLNFIYSTIIIFFFCLLQ